jgi:uncharacterized short protein YbdD (DUF466 family)
MKQRLADLWRFVRTLATDDAYEQYLAHHAQHHGGHAPLGRREFYMHEQQKKWSGIQRCC